MLTKIFVMRRRVLKTAPIDRLALDRFNGPSPCSLSREQTQLGNKTDIGQCQFLARDESTPSRDRTLNPIHVIRKCISTLRVDLAR